MDPKRMILPLSILAGMLLVLMFLVFRQAGIFFLPFFILIPFGTSRKTSREKQEDEDPADWWKEENR